MGRPKVARSKFILPTFRTDISMAISNDFEEVTDDFNPLHQFTFVPENFPDIVCRLFVYISVSFSFFFHSAFDDTHLIRRA